MRLFGIGYVVVDRFFGEPVAGIAVLRRAAARDYLGDIVVAIVFIPCVRIAAAYLLGHARIIVFIFGDL